METIEIVLGIVILVVLGILIYKKRSKVKSGIQDRIEKNAVKIPEVSWTKGKGKRQKTITEDIVIKRSTLPLIGDWARIYPPIDEEGKPIWINILFGGKKNLIKFILIMALFLLIYFWITGIIGVSKEYLNGNKYVIVERPLFEKYCGAEIGNYNTYNNISNLIIYQEDKG